VKQNHNASKALEQARQALKNGDKHAARQSAEQAVRLAPDLEDAWLMMAALASPRASIAFLERALEINPQSLRARKGLAWATERMRREPADGKQSTTRSLPLVATKKTNRPHFPYIVLLVTFTCLVTLWAVWQGVTSAGANNAPGGQDDSLASTYLSVPKPTATLALFEDTATPTASSTPTEVIPTPTYTFLPQETQLPTATEDLVSDLASPTPLPTDTDVPIPKPYLSSGSQEGDAGDVRWIDVDLTNQMVYAYEGNTIVNSFLVSTGLPDTPTVTGQYHIYIKYRYKDLSGPGYYLPDVPFTMFFYEGYALHGTYWHNNFGKPMSRGCVNLSIPDSEWLYNFASVGTLVNIHY